MIFARFSAVLVIAAAPLLSASAAAAEPNRVDARFEIYGFPGLHVLTDRTSVEETANRYAIATELDTRGLASVFVNLTSHSETRGALTGKVLRPEAYRADVRRNGMDRHYSLDYLGDGTVINATARSLAERPLLASTEQLRGTIDQLTAFFLLERSVRISS